MRHWHRLHGLWPSFVPAALATIAATAIASAFSATTISTPTVSSVPTTQKPPAAPVPTPTTLVDRWPRLSGVR